MAMEAAVDQGVPREQVSIINPGIEFSEFAIMPNLDIVRRVYGLDDRLVLLSVGRLARRKGVLEFVRYSLPSIVEEYPTAIFLIIGGNPVLSLSHKEDLKALIQDDVKKLGLEQNVRLLGWVERRELINLYLACDIFVLPAIEVKGDVEGFGIVLIEANAAGKPVVSTRVGGILDAVKDGESGVLVEAGAWDELTNVIINLLADETLRQSIGHLGRERARTQFDWPVIAQQYAELLTGLGEV
jgi:phosphatidylinositol alpha-1,6-mannosyltransferase